MTSQGDFGSLWTGPRGDHRRYRVDLGRDGLISVGNGGEGLVYRAFGAIDGRARDVALKMLTGLTIEDYGRLAERSQVMAQIRHPLVMHQIETFIGTALIDSDEVDDDDFGVIYTVADWVPGEPLTVELERSEPSVGLHWAGQVARAVAYLHAYRGPGASSGIVHRDIKPSNVRVTPTGEAVLIDFGIARPFSRTDLTEGAGTYLWRAPEVVGGPGEPGLASDAWGIGALAHWVLIGEPPRLEGSQVARERLLHAARDKGFSDPIALSRHIAAFLETVPDDRPDDLTRWANDLDAIVTGTYRGKREIVPRIAAAAAAVVGVTALTWFVLPPASHQGHGADLKTRAGANQSTTPSKGARPTPGPVSISTASTSPATSSTTPPSTNLAASSGKTGAVGTISTTTASKPTSTEVSTTATVINTSPSNSTSSTAPATTPATSVVPPTTSAPTTYAETVGGVAHAWTDYSDAGGTEGPSIPSNDTVQIACKVTGFAVADGNTWWYRIAQSPWNNVYYASADAFYNNGETSGSLSGTPFVDPSVPNC